MAKEALVKVLPTSKYLVVTDTLTDEMIKVGEAVVRKLDALHFKVDAALWFYSPEDRGWRLLIANPEVNTGGPLKAYKKIRSAIEKITDAPKKIDLIDISVLDSSARLISLFKEAIKPEKAIGGVRFSRSAIHTTFIEDAYIYRLA